MESESRSNTILVVDDEHTIRDVVRRYLEYDGFVVHEAADGQTALETINRHAPDLIVLDLMLPGIDGLAITRRLRQGYEHIPIIMLTALGETSDRILGLDLGADDYVTKPFSPQELVSRVRAVLRRTGEAPPLPHPADLLTFGNLCLDPGSRILKINGEPVTLTTREFDLLWFLARHPSQVFTRDQLLDHVWGYEFFGDPSTVTVHIRRLREKIEPTPSQPRHIITVWGVGYRFEKE